MKRIAMVAYTHFWTDARVRRAAASLGARGDRVDCYVLEDAEAAEPSETLPGVTLSPISVKRYRGGQAGGYLSSYGSFFVRAAHQVTTQHNRQPYDVVYVHTMPDLMVFVGAFARLRGARVVLDVHDTMPELYQSKFTSGPRHPVIRALRFQERLSIGFADQVIAVHEPHRRRLLENGANEQRAHVVMNLPDPQIFHEPALSVQPAESETIAYHGTIAHRLGLDLALHAFAKLRETRPQARFRILGTGDASNTVKQLIETLRLESSVRFDNRRFRVDEIPKLLQGTAVGVVPNRQDPATKLMLPVKLLEYLHMGIPAIAPRLPAIEHYFDEDTVAYYKPGDVGDMCRAMESVLASVDQRQRMIEKAQDFWSKHNWNATKMNLFEAVDAA